MLPCAILGDSLAVGVGLLRPDCATDAQVGIATSSYAAGHTMQVSADAVLISLGVNDGAPTVGTARHLADLRAGVSAGRVYWLLPTRPELTRTLIQAIARAHGDQVIETRGATGSDGLHLTAAGYRSVAKIIAPPRP